MKSAIPVPAVVAAVVVIVLLVAFFGYRALNQEPVRSGVGSDGKPISPPAGGGMMSGASVPGQPAGAGGKPAAGSQMAQPTN